MTSRQREARGVCRERVVVVTGAGGGMGRAHALELAREGARVIVNDLGSNVDGSGASQKAADQVVEEIAAMGGHAVANYDDISEWDGAKRLVDTALDRFSDLHAVVNNAGILRDRMLVNMSMEEWQAVLRVHLNGTFAVSRHAAAYWRERTKANEKVDARIINTTSASGLYGNVGQSNYGAAKAAIASFTIIASMELRRYGATVNAIAPYALTRMTSEASRARIDAERESHTFDKYDPANVSPLVAWLAGWKSSDVTGRIFNVSGGTINVADGWCAGVEVDKGERWTPSELDEVIPSLVSRAAPNADVYGARPVVRDIALNTHSA